jgi:hypothetical protein
MHCVITGCALVDPESGDWVSGDLFQNGETFIFNGNFDPETQGPAWQNGKPFYSKQVAPTDYFQRRGVFAFTTQAANLNDEANKYIGN